MYHPRYNDILLYGVVISFLSGVLLRSLVSLSLIFYSIFLISATSLFLFFLIKRNKLVALFVILFSLVFVLGALRFELKSLKQKEIAESVELGEVFEGVIVQEPEYYVNHQRFIAKIETKDKKFRVLVSTDRYPEFYYGDRVSIEGDLKTPTNFITDTGREFDYVSYLLKDNIYYSVSFADVSLVESRAVRGLRPLLFSFKQKFLDAIGRVVPDPESALLGGILLGAKQSLGDDIEQNFIDTGTIHIVVLSGYNVTIISEAIVRSFQTIFSERLALSFGSFGILLFVLMSGAGTTTIRAGIMGLLGLLARVTGRTYDILRALFLAGFFMVLINPMTLVFDISFQLSFIATLGLILVTPLVEVWRIVSWLPKKFGIREIFASTIATEITVLPFLLYKIGTLSVVAPLANLLVLPFIPLSMGFGFLAGFFEMLTSLGSNPLSWISFGFLRYIIGVVDLLASFSWSSFTVSGFPLVFVFLLYVGIGYFVWKKRKQIVQKV